MSLGEFQTVVCGYIQQRSSELGLIAERVQVEYILNWGGFVNRSFRISDGRRCLHLKLANRPETQKALRRWLDLDKALRPYHPPPLVAWVDLPQIESAGLLSDWTEGESPLRITGALADSALEVVARLHADSELAACLGEASTCTDTYLETYRDRFAEDLRELSAHRPSFVSESAMRLMQEESRRLEAMARASPAFGEPARSPIHADLWASNFLVGADGAWCLVDWDELRVGDPMLDFAMLLGPSASDLRPIGIDGVVKPFLKSDAERERLLFYARASLLDWAIDSLADYAEATTVPEHADQVRTEKRRIHVEALDLYRTLYF